ncbi:MAG: hypothetical protein LBU85_08700, partial [Treponema sp.]|nr:hypothetical protein [Treponema sp.]
MRGLQWGDIADGIITVQHNYQDKEGLKQPKYNSVRKVPVTSAVQKIVNIAFQNARNCSPESYVTESLFSPGKPLCNNFFRDSVEKELSKNRNYHIEKIKPKLDELHGAADTAEMGELSEALSSLNAETAGLVTCAASVNLFPTYADYDKAWDKQNTADFMPSMFAKIYFPNGTLNYVGARTGRGKTTAMVNIGIDALFLLSENTQPRKVLFISLEETQLEIISRFVLCLAYRNSTAENRAELLKVETPWGEHEPVKTYGAWRQGKDLQPGAGIKAFIGAIATAEQKIKFLLGAPYPRCKQRGITGAPARPLRGRPQKLENFMLRYNQKHRLLSAGAELRGIKPYRLRLIKMAIETGR